MVKLPEKWPYWPPKNFDLKPLSEHWRPAGHLLLSETVDLVGRAIFGEEWTGKELRARHVERFVPEPPSELEGTIHIGIEPGVQRLPPSFNSRGGWRVITTIGTSIVDSKEAAFTLWKQERPKLVEMWRAEHSARKRYDEVARKLRTDLNTGTLRAWAHRTKVGDLVQIPPYVWGREGIESVFELGNNPISWSNPNIIKFSATFGRYGNPVMVDGRVLLSASEVQTYVKQLDHEADASSAGTITAERECAQWIAELASGGYKPANKEAVRQKATDKWGQRLSHRSFERAWASAAPGEWRKPGKKRKG